MTKILAKPIHAWIPDKHAHFLWLSASCLSMLYERNWSREWKQHNNYVVLLKAAKL